MYKIWVMQTNRRTRKIKQWTWLVSSLVSSSVYLAGDICCRQACNFVICFHLEVLCKLVILLFVSNNEYELCHFRWHKQSLQLGFKRKYFICFATTHLQDSLLSFPTPPFCFHLELLHITHLSSFVSSFLNNIQLLGQASKVSYVKPESVVTFWAW